MKDKQSEQGVVTVFLAVGGIVLILILAFAINFAWIVYTKNEAQAAVDAAALAAVAGLPQYIAGNGDTSQVSTLLQAFNQPYGQPYSNPVLKQNPNITLTDVEFINFKEGSIQTAASVMDTTGVRVVKTFTVPLFFDSAMRIANTDVTVSAVATLGSPSCAIPQLPIAVMDCELNGFEAPCTSDCGTSGEGWYAPAAKQTAAYFNYLDEGNSSANARQCKAVINGTLTPPETCVGTIIRLNNGVMASCHNDLRIQCGVGKMNCSVANPWIVDIPVISCASFNRTSGNPVQDAPVSGFIRVGITEVVSIGSDKYFRFSKACGTRDATGGGLGCGLWASSPLLFHE